MTKPQLSKEEQEIRNRSRYHIKMIMGTQHVMIIDNKFRPLTRSLNLDVSPQTIREDTRIFTSRDFDRSKQ